uniref:Uncharacterized protein n=1 Tax=viral metagenome TaxID=1070528 RepID=A0A6M3JG40_9ZZZZ
MANLQASGITAGRIRRPDYVGVINANTAYLPKKKELADLETYRNRTLDLGNKNLDLETIRVAEDQRLARDTLEANKKSSDTANLVGLGQLGVSSFQGAQRDKKLDEIIAGSGGGGSKAVTGTVAPEPVESVSGSGPQQFDEPYKAGGASVATAAPKTDFWSGLKGGASNWGNIASSTLVGGTVGAGLGEKVLGKNASSRVIGGAVTAGGLSYLSSGDPYTAAISAIFGGALGGFT